MYDAQALRGRLALDCDTIMPMQSPIMQVAAYQSLGDLERGRHATEQDGREGRVGVYEVDYRFPMLAGYHRPLDHATVVYDLLSGGSYPFTAPGVQIVSRPVPWCVHASRGGFLCIGEVWEHEQGKMLAAEYVLHIAHIFNFDEPDLRSRQHVVDAQAVEYWRRELKSGPLSAVKYPMLPLDVTHGIPRETAFVPRTGEFAAAVTPARIFQPRAASLQTVRPAAAQSAGFFARRATP
jgi:hypothetical protein